MNVIIIPQFTSASLLPGGYGPIVGLAMSTTRRHVATRADNISQRTQRNIM